MYTATYSPEDNKLRLYAVTRLDKPTYERVRSAGFRWAPKQELFVAPAWTPQREDLLIELAGEIGDEDKSLVDRQEERADRFRDYRDARAQDAEREHKKVRSITDGIPMGQPILVGHHSERHARKDQERIENGMRKALKMWDTSEYWRDRAAGAIRHAKYKELPSVRARRIKTLEADLRRELREIAHQDSRIMLWSSEMSEEQARKVAGMTNTVDMDTYLKFDKGQVTGKDVAKIVLEQANSYKNSCRRWVDHLQNRLAYETAMLDDAGGTVADKTKPEKGGACKCWVGAGAWCEIVKVNKVSVSVADNWGNGGPDFLRTVPFDNLKAIITKAQFEELKSTGQIAKSANARAVGWQQRSHEEAVAVRAREEQESQEEAGNDSQRSLFAGLREQVKAGVKVAIVPQLFPTPASLAARMADMACLKPEHRVLEPSAGTGNILKAIGNQCNKVAVEINEALIVGLTRIGSSGLRIHQGDFLKESRFGLGIFDRILMNPPFVDGQDIDHIKHAMTLLAPGGRIVAICAGGPRQEKQLKPLASSWEPLAQDTFKESGTGVNAVLLTIDKD